MASVDDLEVLRHLGDNLKICDQTKDSSTDESISCAVCSTVQDETFRGYHWIRIDERRVPAKNICTRCSFSFNIVKACLKKGILDWDFYRYLIWESEDKQIHTQWEADQPFFDFRQGLPFPRWSNFFWASGGGASSLRDAKSFEISTPSGKPSPFPDIPTRTSKWSSSGTANVMDFDKTRLWLRACEESHPSCAVRSQTPDLPARVLDVRKLPVKLYEPSAGESAPYICLSHCWGTTRPACMTTAKTLESNRRGIAWDDLPATFRHAIDVTRRLGFDYLWIDSICIIQDSESDWRHQSAEMINIYENSYLTLCATASVDDHGGFYGEIPPERRPHEITVTGPDGKDYELLVRTNLSDRHLPLPWGVDHDENRKKYFPLLTRAWVFQERLLSRRLLHFTKEEIIWECSGLLACECYPGIGKHDYRPRHHEPLDKRVLSVSQAAFRAPKKKPESLEEAAALEVDETPWVRAVECFTALSLSFPRDKLPALSGVAKQIKRRLRPDDEYLAGLWRSTLLPDLCWWSVGQKQVPQRWRGPSWSWVSIDGPIVMNKFRQRATNDVCHVEDAAVRLAGPDAMGEVESGYVVLSGIICAGRMKRGSHVDPKTLRFPKPGGRQDILLAISGDERLMFLDCLEYVEDGTVTIGQEIFCVRTGLYNDADEFCLILKRAISTETPISNESQCYERIGYMMGYSGDIDRWCQGKVRSLIKII
ncbi:heterokaryon incompatibility protein-domain-containing protein [Apiosordaria backusii]|uniref:Heterokaryon incompatibility protein-domain-containing protein n=1 Tax=Apiosordaria backusii TaxID=314023 RepID=A0AA40BS17_9PEZI|nr:heterokaryon incompatibility protein-domain-containing protein [Apiosordaria backusii]